MQYALPTELSGKPNSNKTLNLKIRDHGCPRERLPFPDKPCCWVWQHDRLLVNHVTSFWPIRHK